MFDRRYAYDPNGNVLAIDDLAAPGESQQFGYDALDRLTSASGRVSPALNIYSTEHGET